ncbi:hypothetical protein EJB05_47759, partial [Eragrostis curvula]
MAPSFRPAPLMDELVEEILLRVPPDEPACLMRAALVCKSWCRLVSGPGFRRRFLERHRTPPLLGVIHGDSPRFAPTCSFRHSHPYFPVYRTSRFSMYRISSALDSRHGRVLLYCEPFLVLTKPPTEYLRFRIWDPVAGEVLFLPEVPRFGTKSFNAVVLCAAPGCDHLDCHQGPFLVVLVGAVDRGVFASVYSSEANEWSKPSCARYTGFLSTHIRGTHVGNSVYFVRNCTPRILKYDLGTRKLTVIDTPPMWDHRIVLMTAKGGGLGCITSNESRLYLWSREAGSDGNIGWAQNRVIELKALIPDSVEMTTLGGSQVEVVSFADGSGVIYMGTYYHGSFSYDLKSGRVKKVEGVCGRDKIVPYMSFYTPVFTARVQGTLITDLSLCMAFHQQNLKCVIIDLSWEPMKQGSHCQWLLQVIVQEMVLQVHEKTQVAYENVLINQGDVCGDPK